MPYVGKKPADIIATSVDTTTGTFSGDLTVDTSTLVVDSANNRVGVGTSSPSTLLMVEPSARTTNFSASDYTTYADILVKNPTNDSTCATGIAFITDATTYTNGASGIAAISGSGDAESSLAFITRPLNAVAAERMRIDSSGNVMVGGTNTNPATNNVNGFATVGNITEMSRSSGEVLRINRGNDGTIVNFKSAGTTVGSIGVVSGDRLYIGGGGNNGIGIDQHLFPTDDDGILLDATMNLGASNARYQDLYLSGGVFLGGTGSANQLEDYEEGTWTPTHGGNTSYHSRHGVYIKVGKKVFVRGQVHVNAIGTGSAANMSGLPFTAATTTNGSPAGTNNVSYYSELAIGVTFIAGYVPSGTTTIYTIANSNSNYTTIQYNTGNFFADNTRLDFSMTYETA